LLVGEDLAAMVDNSHLVDGISFYLYFWWYL